MICQVFALRSLQAASEKLTKQMMSRARRPIHAAAFVSAMFGIGMAASHAHAFEGKLLEARESVYNNIFVYERRDLILLSFGYNERIWHESAFDPTDDLRLPFEYTQLMTSALVYPPKLDSVLEIGFGGGRTAWYMHKFLPETMVTAVELDPVVVELSKKYFGISEGPNFQVVVKDGRMFLARNAEKYDVIMIDAYRGPFVPFHLLTTQFYESAKSHLNTGGVIAQNIETTTMLFEAAIATLKTVFDHVDLFDAGGNVIAVAYMGDVRQHSSLEAKATARQEASGFRYALPDLIRKRRLQLKKLNTKALTDDFAPVEALKAIERHNEKIDDITTMPE